MGLTKTLNFEALSPGGLGSGFGAGGSGVRVFRFRAGGIQGLGLGLGANVLLAADIILHTCGSSFILCPLNPDGLLGLGIVWHWRWQTMHGFCEKC